MWDATDLAYMAGLVDADGCIFLDRYKNKRRTNLIYTLRIKINMTDFGAIKWCMNTFGGSYNIYVRENYKPMYNWRLLNKRAANVLTSIKPYLRVKYKQAEIGEEFIITTFYNNCKDRKGRFSSLPQCLLDKKEELAIKMRKLNQRKE